MIIATYRVPGSKEIDTIRQYVSKFIPKSTSDRG